MVAELHRVAEIGGLGAGAMVVEPVPTVKLSAPARYGLASEAPALRDLGARSAGSHNADVQDADTPGPEARSVGGHAGGHHAAPGDLLGR